MLVVLVIRKAAPHPHETVPSLPKAFPAVYAAEELCDQ